MKGKLIDLLVRRDGTQMITLTVDEDFRERFDELYQNDISIEIKKFRKKRSLDANAYVWVLIDKLATALQMDKPEVYRNLIESIGGVSEIVCVKNEAVERLRDGWKHNGLGWFTDTMPSKIPGCTNVILYYGSSTYDTKQMSALIDAAIQNCQAIGIETMPPDQLAALEASWGA